MARRTRSSVFAIKEELVDGDDIIHKSVPTQPESSDRRLRNVLRSATTASAVAALGAAATCASPSASSVSTSRFFPPSSSSLRGQKRKGAGCPPLLPGRTSKAAEAGDEAQAVSKGATAPLSAKAPIGAVAFPTSVERQRRSSSRASAVKMEESAGDIKLEEHSPTAVSAAAAGTVVVSEARKGGSSMRADRKPTGRRAALAKVGEEGLQHTEKKLGRKMGKARRKAKTEAQTGARGPKAEESRDKPVSPRLAEKAALIIQVMDKLYPDPPIPINHMDSFTLLCGVLLSAQTTDAQVNLVTKELFRVAPNPQSLSKMAHNDLQQIIRSVGLAPTKAKHLIALSQQLLDRFEGQVPRTFEGLQSLPGVGRKTAAVVMVQAFNTPAFPVDTHIHRLALRWGLTKNEKNASKVEEDLMAIFPRDLWAKLHLQFIYFGREHCQARLHDTAACPICCWVKKTGPSSPQTVSELTCLNDYLASPTPPKKSSKNAIVYSERILEMEQFRMKLEDK